MVTSAYIHTLHSQTYHYTDATKCGIPNVVVFAHAKPTSTTLHLKKSILPCNVIYDVKHPHNKVKRMSVSERLQCSPLTVNEQFCGSVNCLYGFMPPQAKRKMEDEGHTSFKSFVSTVKRAKVKETVIDQSIGFMTSIESLRFKELMCDKAAAILDSADRCRFVFDGPPHSGTSTVMGLVAREAIERMDDATFIFPVNWANAVAKLTDLTSMFEFVIAQTISVFGWQCGRLFPVIQPLIGFFLSMTSASVVPSLPLSVANMPLFPVTSVEVLAKRVFTAMKTNEGNSTEFLNAIISFPVEFSACFGYRDVLFIYDHIDMCDVKFTDDDDGASMLDCILSCIASHKFLVTSRMPQTTSAKMESMDLQPVHMEGFIAPQALDGVPGIQIASPSVKLNVEMCRGCPVYVQRYMKIVDYLEAAEQELQDRDPKRGFLPISVDFRRRMAKGELVQLLKEFEDARVEGIVKGAYDRLQAQDKPKISLKKAKQ